MHSNTRPEAVWNLVPPGRPPSGPALHTQAKNRPFALLKSLEPPRGPDYFPMENFRRPLWPDDDRVGASGIGAGGGRGHGTGPGTASDRHISQAANARTSQHSSPHLHTPTSGPRGTGRGMASFSPALSRASTTMMTPVQQTQQKPEGFSMFGGKAYSTPASHGSICSQPPLSSHTPIGSNTPTVAPGTIPYGGGGSSGVGGGLARFKTLVQETQEEEHMKQQERRRGSGRGGSSSGCGIRDSTARGMPSPSSNFLSPSSLMGSPPNALTPCDDSPSSSAAYAFTPSSPAAPPSYPNWPAGPLTAAGRKRPRAPSTATAALGRPMTPGTVLSVGGGNLSADVSGARTWGSLAEGSRGRAGQVQQQQQQRRQANPRPPAAHGASGAAARAGVASSVSSRSPRPARNKSPSQSPRTSQPPPTPRRYKLDDFAGADDVCFNAAASSEGLAIFLERCEASGVASLSVLWADLTTSFSAMTVKSCLPSQSCFRWNCACGRQPRAQQATAPMIGAVVYLPGRAERIAWGASAGTESDTSGCSQEDDFEEGEMYLLPLAACVGEDKEAAKAAGYHLPLDCETSYDERWAAFAKLVALPVKKVALMPLIAWRRRPESRTFLARSAAAAAEGGSNRDGHAPSADSSPPPPPQQRQHLSTKHHTTVSGLFDTRVAAWMTDTGKADKALEFEALCVSWLKGEGSDAEGVNAGSGDGGRLPAIVAAVARAEGCCRRNLALAGKISAELEGAKMLAACEQVEMPAIPVLAGMEVSGVVFLPERVTRFSDALGNHLEGLKRTAVKAVGGRDFNLASPDQVADVLFKHLKLPSPPVKAGSVHASTSAEVLEGLQGKHAVVAPILEFRGVNKYKTTYVDKLAERALGAAAAESAVPASQGAGAARIHATWNQTSARTGRLSCSRPNLQQMPKGSDPLAGVEGVNVRDAFSATRSFTLMAADYSQIEMRVLADACRDPGLRNLFATLGGTNDAGASTGGGDVYRKLAAQVFAKEEHGVSDEERNRAKVVCLGITYGMGTPQVAKKLEITESQAQGLVRSFLKAFPGIEPFMAATRRYGTPCRHQISQRRFARENGYVCTLTGRRRHLPEINNSRNAAAKAQAERQAVNSVVQGTAADIMKTAMVLVARRLDAWRSSLDEGLDCPRLIMQIHDELVLECPACEEDLERLKGLLADCMEVEAPAVLGIKCPLTVNMLVGMSWGSMRRVVSHDEDDDDSE
ncbi:DNA polymerase [Ectocarpus siliculosus]|uniref:DNA-directed DNA polymerase n=1 Tax=Ectocarpus siliculosus TaxID=2880 RepID=D7FK42_ECTSI|nr:DNA polymerase [Ectocarpus siliculosus]|eukprot:CBJ29252.1 DNA polymerase [Ectocarpus siliculosus]